ncbi:MAG: carbamoyltransferase family protein [Gemmatimonadales bacterium]
MRILGICHDVVICSACLVDEGRVVAAVPEERLDRVKLSRVFPSRAIDECLALGGVGWADIDEVAVAWNPAIEAASCMPAGYLTGRRWRTEHLLQVPTRLMGQAKGRPDGTTTQSNMWREGPPITYVDHYLAHVGNAAFLSPYDKCAVLVMDGRGERLTGLLGSVDGTEIRVLEEVNFPHSLGLFYGAVTEFLGFRPDSDEWKVMALASYADGKNRYLESMRKMISVDDRGRVQVALEHFEYYNFWDQRLYSDKFVEVFGEPRRRDEKLTPRHEQIAAATQLVFEETMARILTHLHERTKLDRVVVSGGCFMNSVFNGKLTQLSPFSECYITSCPDDSGTSIGAALYLNAVRTKERPVEACPHNYWGRAFSDEQCLEVVRRYKTPGVEIVPDPARRAAEDLAASKLIGWFQGPMEFGQRALGNRSILVDPRREDAKDVVNAAVKYRESFRPFAPAILAEHVAEYFECDPATRVPFMERVLMFRPAVRKKVPAVVHVDGSGRLQTVDENSSPRFHRLIRCFAELTGVPIVLNTSFNLNGEPIVGSPEDALRTFFCCGLDVLYLGNLRIAKV